MVVVGTVFAQHTSQMTLRDDKHPVQKFAARTPHPTRGVRK